MYINKIRKRKCIVLGVIQMYVSLIFLGIGFAGTMNMLFDFNEVRSIWGVFVFMDVSGAILLSLSIRNLLAAKSCQLFDKAFQKSEGRAVTMEELSSETILSPDVALKRLQLLIKKRCLEHVSINLEGDQPVVVLENAALEGRKHITEYIVVTCPNCGGSCSVKRGSISNCEYCGRRVTGD